MKSKVTEGVKSTLLSTGIFVSACVRLWVTTSESAVLLELSSQYVMLIGHVSLAYGRVE